MRFVPRMAITPMRSSTPAMVAGSALRRAAVSFVQFSVAMPRSVAAPPRHRSRALADLELDFALTELELEVALTELELAPA